jgi:hypothetical protein
VLTSDSGGRNADCTRLDCSLNAAKLPPVLAMDRPVTCRGEITTTRKNLKGVVALSYFKMTWLKEKKTTHLMTVTWNIRGIINTF